MAVAAAACARKALAIHAETGHRPGYARAKELLARYGTGDRPS